MMPSRVQVFMDNLSISVTNNAVRPQYRRCANV